MVSKHSAAHPSQEAQLNSIFEKFGNFSRNEETWFKSMNSDCSFIWLHGLSFVCFCKNLALNQLRCYAFDQNWHEASQLSLWMNTFDKPFRSVFETKIEDVTFVFFTLNYGLK